MTNQFLVRKTKTITDDINIHQEVLNVTVLTNVQQMLDSGLQTLVMVDPVA